MISTTTFRFNFLNPGKLRLLPFSILSAAIALLSACGEPPRLKLGEEHIPPGENAAIERVIAGFESAINARDGAGPRRRGAHPKHHGCVKARFEVDADLPAELSVGLFQPGASYAATIRFSNNADPQPDVEPDVRGMAIKLTGVEGQKLLGNDGNAAAHDLLLVSHPVFLFPDVETYLAGFEAIAKDEALSFFFNPLDSHLRAFSIVRAMLQQHNDLLAIRWFSMVPYRFGEGRAVKYGASPCDSQPGEPIPAEPSDNFLGERLAEHLRERDACFEFGIQEQRDAVTMPIENPSVEWNENESPFITVARLQIPKQSFDSPENSDFCEHVSFNPWQALPEHRPLGGISRARKVIYAAMSSFRHERGIANPIAPPLTK